MSKQEQPGSAHWYSAVEAPEVLSDVDAGRWDESADFVVVGYGGAGVAAAIEAAERGLSVIALDRYEGGGSTALNGGIYYAGGGTAIQKQAGVEDSVEAMFQYLRGETQGVVSDATLRDFCEGSAASLDWLIERGVRFDATVYAKKTSYPPPGYHLYHSDSSLCAARAAVAKPAPRGHKVYSPSTVKAATGFGVALTDPLRAAAEKLGVRLHRHSEVRKLITDRSGRVVGVSLWQIPASSPAYAEYARLQGLASKYLLLLPPAFPGAGITMALSRRYAAKAAKLEAQHRVERRIRAKKGVCLSAGGFVFNRQMVDHHAPKYSAGMPLGNPGDDGSGIRLGQSVGGATDRMQHMSAWRFVSPPSGMSWGMMVDGRGKRFSDETAYGAAIGYEIIEHCQGRAWIVFDARLYAEIQKQLKSGELYPFQRDPAKLALMFARKKASTLEALAEKCGLDAATLKGEVEAYNRAAEGAAPDAYGKSAKDAWALQQGPYYALDISIHSRLFPLPTLSLGGLVVDEKSGAVQRADGSAVPGLFAAGRNAVGICSHLYVSGLSAADCIYSGRRAAVAAASTA